MKIIEYLYYHYYTLARKLRGRNPDDSAKLYLSWIAISIGLPFISVIFSKLELIKIKLLYFIIALLYGLVIHYLCKKYILSKINCKVALKRYQNINFINRTLGLIIAVLMIFIPFIFSFWIITLLT